MALSDLMKYQINTSKNDFISLIEEIEFIENYIAYIQWKSNDIQINTTTSGQIQNYQIAPMIFLPLLENAVKYSAHELPPTITMQWVYTANAIEFVIENNFNSNKVLANSTKMGLLNLQRRLELFHPNSTLDIVNNKDIFTAKLKLWNLATVA
jgi:LytS/YehU family sensor histidine kinase